MYKYKCTSRYKMLLVNGEEVLEIRPQEIIMVENAISNKFLKRITIRNHKQETKKTRKKEPEIIVKELKMENTNGSS